jgi:hypothetical protein
MSIRASLMLADSAQAVGGKLYILGGGWNMTTGGAPSAVAILLSVSWDLANTRHEWRLELVDSDDQPVLGPAAEGQEPQPVAATGPIEVGRPAGVPQGTELVMPIAVQLGAIQLQPGRYVWRLLVDGEPDENARAAFNVIRPQN